MGLCKGGMLQVLTVRNPMRARVGDRVKIGLEQRVQYQAYVLAFVIPAAALVFGTVGGHFLGTGVGFPSLDGIGGFTSLIAASFFSLRRLKHLDSSNSIEIVNVLLDPLHPGSQYTEGGCL